MSPMKRDAAQRDQTYSNTMSVGKLARRWKMTRSEIRHLLGRGVLGFEQVRGKFRICCDDVERYEHAQKRRSAK